MKQFARFLFCLSLLSLQLSQAEERVLLKTSVHLRSGNTREWSEFPEQADHQKLMVNFKSSANTQEFTIALTQHDVKQLWRVKLNKKEIGRLIRDENAMRLYFSVPPGTLKADNILSVEASEKNSDDILLSNIILHDEPQEKLLHEGQLTVQIRDAESKELLPGRVTILNQNQVLQSAGATSGGLLAVRPGIIFTGNGKVLCGLPAGTYTVYAGRGFEYGIDSAQVTIKQKETTKVELSIRREVNTKGWVSSDTHVHTLTHSGHGDASIEERMVTLAAENIELPIATDHNKHIDYRPLQKMMKLGDYFTPVIGNEVTTKFGHFNVFPVKEDANPPDFRPVEWDKIFANIKNTPGVQAIIFNHARDLHSNFRPFGAKHHLSLVGENLDSWNLQANAMELINSGAQQTDIMQLYRDWFGLLNSGRVLTPVGCSDSHDVARHFVGQARTFIKADDTHAGKIDVEQAVNNFVAGRVCVSLGLFTEILVNDTHGPGELVPVKNRTVDVSVKVHGPGWTQADTLELYQNGQLIRQETIKPADGKKAGLKYEAHWKLANLPHDINLVAVARGPGVRQLYWPIAKPYQPDSPVWNPLVVGSTGAVWLDVDGNGKRTSAREIALGFVKANPDPNTLTKKLSTVGPVVVVHVAHLLTKNQPFEVTPEWISKVDALNPAGGKLLREYVDQLRQSKRARIEANLSTGN